MNPQVSGLCHACFVCTMSPFLFISYCLLSSTTSFLFPSLAASVISFSLIKRILVDFISPEFLKGFLSGNTFTSLSSPLSSSVVLYLTGAACVSRQGSRGRRVTTSWTWMSSAAWRTVWLLRPTRGGSAGWSKRN